MTVMITRKQCFVLFTTILLLLELFDGRVSSAPSKKKNLEKERLENFNRILRHIGEVHRNKPNGKKSPVILGEYNR